MCGTCVYRVWLVDDCDIDCDVGFVLGGLLENLECVVESIHLIFQLYTLTGWV